MAELTIAAAERAQRREVQEVCIAQDLDASLNALAAERSVREKRLQGLRHYITALQAAQAEYVRRQSELPGSAASAATDIKVASNAVLAAHDLLLRLSALGEGATAESSGQASEQKPHTQEHIPAAQESTRSISSGSDLQDDRPLLLRDVENLYQRAVCAQEELLRRRQHLGLKLEAAQGAVQERRQQLALVEEQLLQLAARRRELEAALQSCTSALQQSFVRVAEQVREVGLECDSILHPPPSCVSLVNYVVPRCCISYRVACAPVCVPVYVCASGILIYLHLYTHMRTRAYCL